MEGSGSRDIANYYLGGTMPSANSLSSTQNEQEPQPQSLDHPASSTHQRDSLAANTDLGGEQGHGLLSEKEQTSMMQSIIEIFELEESTHQGMDEEDEDVEEVIDLEDRERRTERLKGALSVFAQLWWSGSAHVDLCAEKLADGSRDPKWRIPLGDSGVLNFFLEILSKHALRHTLKIHVLRLIGNSCADTDENRARVVASNYLPAVIMQLNDDSLLPFAIPVLYNICIDYEPAQKQASDCHLTKDFIQLLSISRFKGVRSFFGYISKLLALFVVKQTTEPDLAPENTAIVLLSIAADRELPTNMEDFISITNTAVAYLQHGKFQQSLIAQGALYTILTVLVDSYTRFDSHPSLGSPSVSSSSPDQDDAKLLSEMRSNLNQVLSDISALPEFKEAIPVTSPFSSSLRRWLSSPQLQLQVCACIMLGNLARSDAACEEFVHTSKVHIPLIAVLANASDSQILHAALGFLKNLALPMKNKEILGKAGIFEVLPRLWVLDTLQQIQFSSVSLARQLIIGTFENTRPIFQRLSDDPDSPANMRSHLSTLIALFERTDVEPIKMEISRLLTAVCRVFNTYKGRSPEDMERIRKEFFIMHPDVGRPLGFMVSQNKWPVVRSEGWFVFALMARYPEGAHCISDLLADLTVWAPLVELLTGKTMDGTPIASPREESEGEEGMIWDGQGVEPKAPTGQEAEMKRIDRENALVLITELLRNRGDEMAVVRKSLFEDLLRGGGELVMIDRNA